MKIYIMIADGFEETEALVPWDILKRAGADVKLVSVSKQSKATGSHGLVIDTDTAIDSVQNNTPDLIVLPGGMPGMLNLKNSVILKDMLVKCEKSGKLVAAICASPAVLGAHGLLKGRSAVCFPGFESQLEGARVSEEFVCRDGNIITAKGMGVSFVFAFALVSALYGDAKAEELKKGAQYIK